MAAEGGGTGSLGFEEIGEDEVGGAAVFGGERFLGVFVPSPLSVFHGLLSGPC